MPGVAPGAPLIGSCNPDKGFGYTIDQISDKNLTLIGTLKAALCSDW